MAKHISRFVKNQQATNDKYQSRGNVDSMKSAFKLLDVIFWHNKPASTFQWNFDLHMLFGTKR